MDLNLGDGEENCDVFGEYLNLAAMRSLRCFCVVGGILLKSCVVDGDTFGGAAMVFVVNTLISLKVGGCSSFSAEEALEKMKSSWKSALRVMVSDGGSRIFLLICLNAAVKHFAVDIIMSLAVSVGMMSLWGKYETPCPMRTELVAVIQILCQ